VKKESVSILIPAHGAQNFIELCLNTIEKQTYFQNFNHYEILVGVDNCRETLNKLIDIRRQYRNLRVFMMKENKGTYITKNTLISLSEHQHLFFFDSDDLMDLNLVERVMEETPKYDVVQFSFKKFVDEGGYNDGYNIKYSEGAIYYNRSVFERYGGFQPWVCSADTELFFRLRTDVKKGVIDEPLFFRRLHGKSLTLRKETGRKSELRKKYFKLIDKPLEEKPFFIKRVENDYLEIL
jgi:glycosyltransferase involved in cell wall biosynthesis